MSVFIKKLKLSNVCGKCTVTFGDMKLIYQTKHGNCSLCCFVYCKFGNFREGFIFARLRICEV